jgi:hypothetical protein
MFRKPFVALGVLLLCAGGLRAAEGYRAWVQKIDLDRGVIVVKSGEKERPIKVGPGVVLQDEDGQAIAFDSKELGKKGFREGKLVTVTVAMNQKEAVVIKLLPPARYPASRK